MWFVLATFASMCWGVFYIVSEHLYKQISVFTAIAVESFFLCIVATYFAYREGSATRDIVTLMNSGKLFGFLAIAVVVSILAEVAINISISQKDATLTGFV